jgi:glycosyltransferase involved in cell wall biosynthesis
VIVEAFACGTPVYTTPVSGVPDVVVEGETGFQMESTDPDDVARRVRRILDREDLPTVSRNARELVETEYTYDATVDRYREMFADIV